METKGHPKPVLQFETKGFPNGCFFCFCRGSCLVVLQKDRNESTSYGVPSRNQHELIAVRFIYWGVQALVAFYMACAPAAQCVRSGVWVFRLLVRFYLVFIQGAPIWIPKELFSKKPLPNDDLLSKMLHSAKIVIVFIINKAYQDTALLACLNWVQWFRWFRWFPFKALFRGKLRGHLFNGPS